MLEVRKKSSYAITAIATAFIMIALALNISYENCRVDILLLFFTNGVIFYGFMMRSLTKQPYSLELMFWFFMFYFMFFAPLIQYSRNSFPWGRLGTTTIVQVNFLLLLFACCFKCGTKLYRHRRGRAPAPKETQPEETPTEDETKREGGRDFLRFLTDPIESSVSYSIFLLFFSFLILLYTLQSKGLAGMLVSRGDNVSLYQAENSSLYMLVTSVTNAFLTFSTAYAICLAHKQKGVQRFILPTLHFLCLLLCCFPTALSRNKMACIYIGLLLVMFHSFSKGSIFYWFFSLALVFMFPFMELFRYTSLTEVNVSEFISGFSDRFFESYTEAHYDAYAMFGQTIKYTQTHGFAYGHQLLGSLLFFVPRVIWPTKPIGSGATIMEAQYRDFTNVSCPLVAEGYINFGLVGVILFGLIVGYMVSRFDIKYWSNVDKDNKNKSAYVFILPMFFFIMRGDLMSSWAYTMGFAVVAYCLRLGYRFFGISRRKVG